MSFSHDLIKCCLVFSLSYLLSILSTSSVLFTFYVLSVTCLICFLSYLLFMLSYSCLICLLTDMFSILYAFYLIWLLLHLLYILSASWLSVSISSALYLICFLSYLLELLPSFLQGIVIISSCLTTIITIGNKTNFFSCQTKLDISLLNVRYFA